MSDGKDPVPVTSLAEVERGESAEVREALRQQQIVQREEVRGKSQFLALGLHAVTKALEKNKLEVVIVCKDAEPTRLVQHIPVQAFLTDTPLVVLGGDLSLRLGAIFGIRTVIALGIKKRIEHQHGELVEFLKAKATPLDIPWLLPAKAAHLLEREAPPVTLPLQPLQVRRAHAKRPDKTPESGREKADGCS